MAQKSLWKGTNGKSGKIQIDENWVIHIFKKQSQRMQFGNFLVMIEQQGDTWFSQQKQRRQAINKSLCRKEEWDI